MAKISIKTKISFLYSRGGDGLKYEGNYFMFQRVPTRWQIHVWSKCEKHDTKEDVFNEVTVETKQKLMLHNLLQFMHEKADEVMDETKQMLEEDTNLVFVDCGWEATPLIGK